VLDLAQDRIASVLKGSSPARPINDLDAGIWPCEWMPISGRPAAARRTSGVTIFDALNSDAGARPIGLRAITRS